MTGRYAAKTEVSSDRTRLEIEHTLRRYGAEAYVYGWEENQATIQFKMSGKYIRMMLTLPDKAKFLLTPAKKYKRSEEDVVRAWEQASRQKWRALALVVKAKLEAVEAGITTFESEFLAHIVLPNRQTVGEWILPQVDQVYLNGGRDMPRLLPGVVEDQKHE